MAALTQGLRRQITVGSLEDLSLEGNYLGTSFDVCRATGVLCFSPCPTQLSNRQVGLKYNQLQRNPITCLSCTSPGKAKLVSQGEN